MNIQEWLNLLIKQLKETGWLQWVSVTFAVAEVLYAKSNKIWLYPTGIIATSISIYILFVSGLFAESALSLYYLIMSIYGWWNWAKKKSLSEVKPMHSSKSEMQTALFISIFGTTFIYFLLIKLTPSTIPFWDAIVSAIAWAGMWLLTKRKIENWIWLNVSNAIAIPLLFYKQLPLYALLTLFLFIVAIFGYIKWHKIIKQNNSTNSLVKQPL